MIDFSVMRDAFSQFYTDIIISATAEHGEVPHLENAPCHLSILKSDVAEQYKGGLPNIYGRISTSVEYSISNNDTVVVGRVDPKTGQTIARYTGVVGTPSVYQSRKSFDFQIAKVEQSSIVPPKPDKPVFFDTVTPLYSDSGFNFGDITANGQYIGLKKGSNLAFLGTGFDLVGDNVIITALGEETGKVGSYRFFRMQDAPEYNLMLTGSIDTATMSAEYAREFDGTIEVWCANPKTGEMQFAKVRTPDAQMPYGGAWYDGSLLFARDIGASKAVFSTETIFQCRVYDEYYNPVEIQFPLPFNVTTAEVWVDEYENDLNYDVDISDGVFLRFTPTDGSPKCYKVVSTNTAEHMPIRTDGEYAQFTIQANIAQLEESTEPV